MKILHSADWHLDAPMSGHSEEEARRLHKELRKIPEKIAKLCKTRGCDLMILAGDLFDGPYTKESMTAVRSALESVQIPVIITPGNHDYCSETSPYLCEEWPGNVHIFTKPQMESFDLPELDCTVYGAGYTAMDCPALLKHFRAQTSARWAIGVLHGDPGVANSPYCPVSKSQIQDSGLNYLAMGHIHKGGALRMGDTLCAWPGCPMGHGYDELGTKGVLIANLDEETNADFVPLDTPCFYDEEVEAGDDPVAAVAALLPSISSSDFYRITLTGYSAGVNLKEIAAQFPHIPNLVLRDETIPEADIWSDLDADTLEGEFFRLLHKNFQSESPILSSRAKLAARIARQILDGQEVKLT